MTATLKNEQGQKPAKSRRRQVFGKKKTMARKNSSTNKPKKKKMRENSSKKRSGTRRGAMGRGSSPLASRRCQLHVNTTIKSGRR